MALFGVFDLVLTVARRKFAGDTEAKTTTIRAAETGFCGCVLTRLCVTAGASETVHLWNKGKEKGKGDNEDKMDVTRHHQDSIARDFL
jgi:hypothetical protein